MKSNLFILTVFALLSSCSSNIYRNLEQEQKMTSFATISMASSIFDSDTSLKYQPITLIYRTLAGLDENTALLNKDEEVKLFVSKPTYVYCTEINRPLLVFPKDELKIEMEAFGSYSIQSKNPSRQKEINFFLEWVDIVDSLVAELRPLIIYKPLVSEKNALFTDSIIKFKLSTCKKTGDSLLKANKGDHYFVSVCRNYLQSKLITEELDYYWVSRKYSENEVIFYERYTELVDFFNRFKSNDDLIFYYSPLKELVRQILAYKTKTSAVFDISSFKMYLLQINDYFKGLAKDYALADAIYTAYKNKVISSKEMIVYAKKECDSKYKQTLEWAAKKYKSSEVFVDTKKGFLVSPFSSQNGISEDVFFSKYKGKVVLVDFWASWCVPCRKEMPQMRELKRLYLNKNIVFVTISIDRSLLEWQRASKMEDLNPDNSFIVDAVDSVYKFKGKAIEQIPRYFLLNKDGSIIDDNAPPPSSNDLRILIDRYL